MYREHADQGSYQYNAAQVTVLGRSSCVCMPDDCSMATHFVSQAQL